MSKKQKNLAILASVFLMLLTIAPVSNAMHIMEGFLPVKYCILWGVICVPFLVIGFMNIKKVLGNDRRTLTVLALTGAFVFVLSSLKIPSVTGSCSHMTGTGLGAILFGPCVTSILGIIVLIFQAILLAHGGLTTLGANCFSMAIAGPIISWILYKLLQKANVNKRVCIFVAAFLGYILRNKLPACTCLPFRSWRHWSIYRKIPRNLRYNTASISSNRRYPHCSYRYCT